MGQRSVFAHGRTKATVKTNTQHNRKQSNHLRLFSHFLLEAAETHRRRHRHDLYLNTSEPSSPISWNVCSDAMFLIQPTARPRAPPPPGLAGESAAAASVLRAGLMVGVAGGVRDVSSGCPSVCQVKVRLDLGVASGVGGRSCDPCGLCGHRLRPEGRGVSLETTYGDDVMVTDRQRGVATASVLPVPGLVLQGLLAHVCGRAVQPAHVSPYVWDPGDQSTGDRVQLRSGSHHFQQVPTSSDGFEQGS